MDKYIALQPTNYDGLHLNHETLTRNKPQDNRPRCLVLQCCAAICQQGGDAAKEAVLSIPHHLTNTLLREAMVSVQAAAMASMVANWPLNKLCFRDVLPDPTHRGVFEEDMGLNVMLFKGITGLTRKCRIRTLDLRGFPLNWNFAKLIVEMWPLLSLRKTQRNVKKLTNIVLKTAGLKKDNKMAREIIPKLIEDLLNHDMAKHPDFSIVLPKGERMTVKIDSLEFSTQNTFFMEYLLTNCLRSITQVCIEPSNIIIKSDLNVGDEILDSLAPFIVFRGQNIEPLDGVWVENLEDNVFFITCQDLQCFTNLTRLALPNCNIMLQEGRTRRRTSTRYQFTNLLQHFHHLTRLDLSQNSFAGCLNEVLEALVLPLQYLSLRECDLGNQDIQDLAASKHCLSLRQLDLSRVCGLFPDDSFAVSTSTLIQHLKCFENISIIHLQQNQIIDTRIDEICRTISSHWPKLKGLDITENVLKPDSVIKIVRTCASIDTQYLKIPYCHNFLENFNIFETARQNFIRRISEELKGCDRTDIEVHVLGLAYAVLGHL